MSESKLEKADKALKFEKQRLLPSNERTTDELGEGYLGDFPDYIDRQKENIKRFGKRLPTKMKKSYGW